MILFFASQALIAQHEVQIHCNFGAKYKTFSVKICTTNDECLASYNFSNPDTVLSYRFPADPDTNVYFIYSAADTNSFGQSWTSSGLLCLNLDSSVTKRNLTVSELDPSARMARSYDAGFFNIHRDWALGGAFSVQRGPILEVAAVRTSLERPSETEKSDGQFAMRYLAYCYMNFGANFLFQDNNFGIAPKAGLGFQLLLLDANFSFVWYNNFDEIDCAIVPEIGFSIFGWFKVNYGYNIFFNNDSPFRINTHCVTIRIDWFFNQKNSSKLCFGV